MGEGRAIDYIDRNPVKNILEKVEQMPHV